LYDTLLEQNLLRIVEPYSVVEIDYVAQTVGQGRQAVEAKYVPSIHFMWVVGDDSIVYISCAGCPR
jgi:hypothetical protein